MQSNTIHKNHRVWEEQGGGGGGCVCSAELQEELPTWNLGNIKNNILTF